MTTQPPQPRRLGVVMDPIEKISPKKDSTLAMLLAAQARGWQIVYFEQGDLALRDGVATGAGCLLEVEDRVDSWFRRGLPWRGDLHELDALLMRKDPPFDTEYIYTTYILERAEERGLLVANKPQSLRDINEKVYTAWFPECTPPSIITRSRTDLLDFLAAHGKIVVKPLHSMGGRSIFVIERGDLNTNVVIETLTDYGSRYTLAQRYLPEITYGDKRILLVDGKPVPFALARIPAKGETRGNLVAGATGESRELSDRDRWICEQVGAVLASKGVVFAGLDVIGDYLTEINVTSPTGIRELERQRGLDIAGNFIEALGRHLCRTG